MSWESAERVQKNEAGEFRALIGGEWIPVTRAQKSEAGDFRVDRAATPVAPTGERMKHASDSWLSNMPDFPKSVQEFATGGTGILRGVFNAPGKIVDAARGPQLSDVIAPGAKKQGIGDIMFPPQGDPESGFKTAGSIADPLAWAIGGGVPAAAAKTLERMAASGPAAAAVAAKLAANWAGRATGRAVAGGAAGGAIGALSEEGDTGTGAAVGAAANVLIPPVFSGVMRGATAAKNAIYPSPASIAVKAAGDKTDDVITALTNSQSGVTGANLTAGQASVPANSAEFAALQKLVASKDPSRYAGAQGVQGQQEAARLAELQTIGKTPADLAQAVATRSTNANTNYGSAYQQLIRADPNLMAIAKNPFFKDEVTEAMKLAQAKGIDPKANLTEFLHFVKEGIDAKLQSASKPDAPAISNASKAALTDVKNKLVTWLGNKNPAYDAARRGYMADSKPINQMKLGQEIEQALVAPVTGSERASSFGGAVRKAENKISKATGMPRIDDLTPRQQKVLDVIEENLKLDADYKKLASAGSSNLDNRIGAIEVPPTGIFQPAISAARSWLNRILGTGQEKALQKLAPLMEKNPQAFAQIMRQATPQQRAAVNSMLSEYVTTGAISVGAQQ